MASIPPNQPQTTAERLVPSTKDEIIKEAKRLEESALYSSKGHFAAAQFWGISHLCIGIAISAVSAIAAAFTFSDSYRVAVGILVLGVAMLSAVATFLNPNEKAASHLIAGNNYDALCTRSRMFWTIECWKDGNTEQVLSEKLRDLYEEKNKLNQSCPQIPGWAYSKGKKRIEAGEGVYQVDKRV
jgi:hypothetical protein